METYSKIVSIFKSVTSVIVIHHYQCKLHNLLQKSVAQEAEKQTLLLRTKRINSPYLFL